MYYIFGIVVVMNNKIVFLDIVIFSTFLSLILSYVFSEVVIDFTVLLALLLVYILAYVFFYNVGNFKKILFVLSICFLIFSLSHSYSWASYNFSAFVIIFYWYIIWFIFKGSGILNEIIGKSLFGSILFILFLIFNLIVALSPNNEFDFHILTTFNYLQLNISLFAFAISIILLIIFVGMMIYDNYSVLDYNNGDNVE